MTIADLGGHMETHKAAGCRSGGLTMYNCIIIIAELFRMGYGHGYGPEIEPHPAFVPSCLAELTDRSLPHDALRNSTPRSPPFRH